MHSVKRPPHLGELPPPPEGKMGWPWTVTSSALSDTMPDGQPWPRISIVTPSFNQGQYIEETIRSVLMQGYPNLEYIVLDGGSTDGSVEVIQEYEKHLTYWISRRDGGQAQAINQGLAMVSGEWFNWLNSDDILMPGALRTLAEIASIAPAADWITGGRMHVSETGAYVAVDMPWIQDPSILACDLPGFPQDATFIKPQFLRESTLRLREDLQNIFDTVLYYELLRLTKPIVTTAVFSALRLHGAQKTANLGRLAEEQQRVLQPLLKQRSLCSRLGLRLLGTRYHRIVRAILRCSLYSGFPRASREWQAAAFSVPGYRWDLVPARSLLR